MTPAGTSNELDVQNEWEENTHTTLNSNRLIKKEKKLRKVRLTYDIKYNSVDLKRNAACHTTVERFIIITISNRYIYKSLMMWKASRLHN